LGTCHQVPFLNQSLEMGDSWPLLTFTLQCWLIIFFIGKGVDRWSGRRLSTWLNRHHITWALGILLYEHQFRVHRNAIRPRASRQTSQQLGPTGPGHRLQIHGHRILRFSFELGAYLTLLIGFFWMGWLVLSIKQWTETSSQYALARTNEASALAMQLWLPSLDTCPVAIRGAYSTPPVESAVIQIDQQQAATELVPMPEAKHLDPAVDVARQRHELYGGWLTNPVQPDAYFTELERHRPLLEPFRSSMLDGSLHPYSPRRWQRRKRVLRYVQSRLEQAYRLIHPSDLFFLALAIGLAVLIHELGHALAATLEAVPLTHLGIFIVACFPGAYIRLHAGAMASLSPRRQLRIYAAGCVQSFLAALVALALLNALPFLAQVAGYVFANDGYGAVVVWVHPSSLWHPVIEPGSRLIAVDGHAIQFAEDISPWQASRVLWKRGTSSALQTLTDATYYRDRVMVASAAQREAATDCAMRRPPSQWHYMVFERPGWALSRDTQRTLSTQAISAVRAEEPARTTTRQVLWFDEPIERVLDDIRLSDYAQQSKAPWIALDVLHGVEKLLAYLFLVSLGLGLVNILPAMGLDGAHLLELFVEALIRKLGNRHPSGARLLRLAAKALLLLHTFLLVGLWFLAVLSQRVLYGKE
jgi:hypothetical protein